MLPCRRYYSMLYALTFVTLPIVSSFSLYSTSLISHRTHEHPWSHHDVFIVSAHSTSNTMTTSSSDISVNRRRLLIMSVFISNLIYPNSASAVVENSKLYIDPQGLFSLRIPQRYFVIRRETQGDDGSSPTSRSGSSILLTAGDLSKAQVVSIERFPISQLLQQQAGISPDDSLSSSLTSNKPMTFSNIGTALAIVQLLVLRRDRDRMQQQQQQGILFPLTRIAPDSIQTSTDDQSITFQLMTDIPVQKPELLMEQYGVNQLIRLTLGKVSIAREDGTMMVIYASGLQQDLIGRAAGDGTIIKSNMKWTEDGRALLESVDSFVPLVV